MPTSRSRGPEGAPKSWKPAWTVKVRYKSGTTIMLGEAGQAMAAMQAGMMSDDEGDVAEAPVAAPPPRKRRGLLGVIIEQAISN
jgi:hypothetical protein